MGLKERLASTEQMQKLSQTIFKKSELIMDEDGRSGKLYNPNAKDYVDRENPGKPIGWIKINPNGASTGWMNLPDYIKLKNQPDIHDSMDYAVVDLKDYGLNPKDYGYEGPSSRELSEKMDAIAEAVDTYAYRDAFDGDLDDDVIREQSIKKGQQLLEEDEHDTLKHFIEKFGDEESRESLEASGSWSELEMLDEIVEYYDMKYPEQDLSKYGDAIASFAEESESEFDDDQLDGLQ